MLLLGVKGGDVGSVYALKALREAGALKDASIIVILTGDEENTGRPNERRIASMIAAAQRSDVALRCEGRRRGQRLRTEGSARSGRAQRCEYHCDSHRRRGKHRTTE